MPSLPNRPDQSPIPDAHTAPNTGKMCDLPDARLSPAQRLDIYWPTDKVSDLIGGALTHAGLEETR